MIFCEDCKYFKLGLCEHSTNREIEVTPEGTKRYHKHYNSIDGNNKDNSCPFYQKSRWRWWVKEKGTKFDFNKDKFIDFCIQEHPEILMEYKLTWGNK
jgi:hypothetical protein